MEIVVRSPLGVYYQLTVESYLEALLPAAGSEPEARHLHACLEAYELHQRGRGPVEIARMLEISRTTTWRRIHEARRWLRGVTEERGTALAE